MHIADAPFADLVFHVLAHVRAGAEQRASVYDEEHVRFASKHIGATLREDVAALDAIISRDPAVLEPLQLVAWIFHSIDRARAEGRFALAELDHADDDDALEIARGTGDAGELLWCAVLLEREAHAKLPRRDLDRAVFVSELRNIIPVAPALAELATVSIVPALGIRGRVRGDEIWIGARSLEHSVWQAAHEATVHEVGGDETRAIHLLRDRVRGTLHEEAHARWFSHLENLRL